MKNSPHKKSKPPRVPHPDKAILEPQKQGLPLEPAYTHELSSKDPSSPNGDFQQRQLTYEQEQLVCADASPLLVHGGAGTGKSTLLQERILFLLGKGIAPTKILLLTATRIQAMRMRTALKARLPDQTLLPHIETLRSAALGVWSAANKQIPLLLSDAEAQHLAQEMNAPEQGSIHNEARPSTALNKALAQSEELQKRYAEQKKAWNLVDFNDLLSFWQDHAPLISTLRGWTQVLVDDLQYRSEQELKLLSCLMPPSGEGFYAVCGHIGAQNNRTSPELATQLLDFWPQLKQQLLSHNFYAAKNIVSFCNELAASKTPKPAAPPRNHSKTHWEQTHLSPALFPQVPWQNKRGIVHLFSAPSEEQEVLWICRQLERLLLPLALRPNLSEKENPLTQTLKSGSCQAGQIGIAVRTKEFAEQLWRSLQKNIGQRIAFALGGQSAFWQDTLILHLLKLVKPLFGLAPQDETIENPPCPAKILLKGPLALAAYFDETPPFSREFWKSPQFHQLDRTFIQCGGNWPDLLTFIGLHGPDEFQLPENSVPLLTYEETKQCTFKILFLPGLEDGFVPFAAQTLSGKLNKNKPEQNSLADEHALFLQTAARASSGLLLSHASHRPRSGASRLAVSRFLRSLPEGSILSSSAVLIHNTRQETQLSLWPVK